MIITLVGLCAFPSTLAGWAQIPYLTFWEVVHYWFHAACEVLVANDYTRKIGKAALQTSCVPIHPQMEGERGRWMKEH